MKDTEKSATVAAAAPSSGSAASATAPPPAPVDPTAISTHRLHLGGFRDAITSLDISSRFSSFGQVSEVVIPATETGLPRGFAHFSLTSTHAQYTRLLSVYNGTKWKGGVISLHPAKPRPQDLRQAEHDRIVEKERARALNFGNQDGGHQDVMPLDGGWPAWQRAQVQLRRRARRGAIEGKHVGYINEVMADDAKHLDLAGKHRLWKRVKFGRVLPVMRRLRTPLGPITMDPSRMRDGFERLYSSAKGGKRVEELIWEIAEEEDEDDEAQEVGKSMDYWEDVEREMKRVNGEQFGQNARVEEDGDSEETEDVSLMDVDGEDGQALESESGNVRDPPAKPASAARSMFFDDEESDADEFGADVEMANGHEDDERFEYKEQFVGEQGKHLLALQKKAKGDDRFKFTSDFAPDAPSDADDSDAEPDFFDSLPRASHPSDPNASEDHPDLDENDENAAKNVRKERSMAMSLLAGMFGAEATRDAVDHARLQSKGLKPTGGDRTFELTGMVFYDPMSADAAKYEIAPPEVTDEDADMDAEEVQEKKKPQKQKKSKAKKKYSFESSSEDEDTSDEASGDEADAMEVDAPKTIDNGVSSLFAKPIVETDSATVHADFSSIFTRGGPTVEASGFSLFGAGAPDSSDSDSDSDSDAESKSARPFFATQPSHAGAAAKSAGVGAGSGKATGARPITLASPFLFLTLERLAAAESKSFVRTRSDAEAKFEWQATRWELMAEVRKRHKNAARKARQRAAGRMAAGGGVRK